METRPVPRHPRLLVAGLVLICANTGFVGSLGVPLVPMVQEDYGASLGHAQWSATVALLAGAVATPILGRLSDGRDGRRLIWIALVLMALGCLLSIPHLGLPVMIAGRALQGVGMALTPLAITAARITLSPRQFAGSVGYLSVATAAGVGLSFPVVTWIASHVDLHAAYVFGFAVAFASLVVAVVVVPPFGATGSAARVDVVGALLLAAAVTALLLLITRTDQPLRSALTLAAVTLVATALLTRWSRRHPEPFVDLAGQLSPARRRVNLIGMFVGLGAYAGLAMVSLRIQAPESTGYGLGRSAFAAGCMLIAFAVANFASNRFALLLQPVLGGERVLVTGSVLTTVGLLVLSFPIHSLGVFAVVAGLIGLGCGATFSITPVVISELVDAPAMGAAMSFNQLLRYLGFAAGGSLAVAVLEVLGTSDGHPLAESHRWAALACAVVPATGVLFLRRGPGLDGRRLRSS